MIAAIDEAVEMGCSAMFFHGGEVDEPNRHVRDTLLLGATRIGHGTNLITDPDTLLLMRTGKSAVSPPCRTAAMSPSA